MSENTNDEKGQEMSEQAATNPKETTDTITQASEPADTAANSEAAKYRRKLREAEAERDQAITQRDALARSVAEQYLPSHVPARLFWEKNQNVIDMLGDDGRVDQTKVKAAAKNLADEYGLKSSDKRLIVEADGRHFDPHKHEGTSWASVVRGPNSNV
ncbi:MAG: hypothetical protein LKJ18_00625 [Ancrocorticia sp.]|jgi:very-short-patch-repair endonuclease|nr:hypothetical protein [Ancrocorticia sp.]MCI2002431.1 hypothetical protein [Ancrocorticia sp.]